MDLKVEFCRLAYERSANLSELCRRYAISRPTAYRLLEHYRAQGLEGLAERCRPHASPGQTCPQTQAYLIGLKARYPFWGAAKLLALFRTHKAQGLYPLPDSSLSAAERILRQAGLVSPRRQAAALA